MVKHILKGINQQKKKRKAQSLMVSYVILISIVIALSIGVFSWLKYAANIEPEINCEDGTSVILTDISCTESSITFDLKNNGRFSIEGIILTVSNSTGLARPTYLIPDQDDNQGLDPGSYFFVDKLKPSKTTSIDYSNQERRLTGTAGYGEAITVELDKLRSVQIQPFIRSERGIVVCQNALIKQNIDDCTGYVAPPIPTFDPLDIPELISWWKFEGNAYDSILESGNDGEVVGATYNPSGGHDGNGAYEFDGMGDYIRVAESDFEGSNQQGTVAAWIKTSDNSHITWLSSADESSIDYFISFSLLDAGSGDLRAGLQDSDDGGFYQHGNTTINDGEWHHVVISSDSNLYKIYVDGVENSITSQGGGNGNDGAWFADIPNRDNLIMGALKRSSEANFWNGSIDDVMIFGKALSATEVGEIYDYVAPPTPPSPSFDPLDIPELISWWKFEGNAYDSILGSGNDGNVVGATYNPSGGHDGNGAYEFDDGDYIEVEDHDDLSFGDGLTDLSVSISAWIYVIGHTENQPIITKYKAAGGREWFFHIDPSERLVFRIWNPDTLAYRGIQGEDPLNPGWNYVAITYDGRGGDSAYDGMTLYINNILVSTTDITYGSYYFSNNTTTKVIIGSDVDKTIFFQDKIDDVMIFNKALSEAEIGEIYDYVAPAFDPLDLGPISWWKFEGNAYDSILGSGNDGEVVGATYNPSGGHDGNGAYEFDGDEDYIEITDNSDFDDFDTGFTVTAWAKPVDWTMEHNTIVGQEVGFLLAINSAGNLSNYIDTETKPWIQEASHPIIPLNTWTHFALTYNGSMIKSYINGILQGPGTPQTGDMESSSTVTIGRRDPTDNQIFNGSIDDVMIFGKALDKIDVGNIYNFYS